MIFIKCYVCNYKKSVPVLTHFGLVMPYEFLEIFNTDPSNGELPYVYMSVSQPCNIVLDYT